MEITDKNLRVQSPADPTQEEREVLVDNGSRKWMKLIQFVLIHH